MNIRGCSPFGMLLWKGVFGNLCGGFVGERPRWSVTKAARRLCWGRTSVWLFSCGFVAYFSGCLFMRAPLEGYFCIRNTHYIYIYVIMKTMCPPSYHHNGFVATHALGHMMYGYTLLVPMNQRVLNKLNKEHNITGHK